MEKDIQNIWEFIKELEERIRKLEEEVMWNVKSE